MRKPHVEKFLREFDDAELLKWKIAFERIPLTDTWLQTDIVAGVMHDGALLARYAAAGETPPEELFHTAGEYIPGFRDDEEELVVQQNKLDQYQATLEAKFGAH